MKVAFLTFGCKLNLAETENFIHLFQKNGFEVTDKKDQAHLYIIRGCSVTKKAEKETRGKIQEIKKDNHRNLVIATGCISQNFFSAADLCLPKKKENLLFKKAKELVKKKKNNLFFTKKNKGVKEKITLKTRSLIKIQDGCNNFCTYCLVPYLRSGEKNYSAKKIIKEICLRVKNGYQEVVLVGTNIGQWRERVKTKSGKVKTKNLIWLIKKILEKTSIPRIRISSLWPSVINDKFLKLFNNPRLCQHLHLSCQSFSNVVLKKMGRFYQPQEIKNKIKKIKKMFPELSLTTDIITGFAGETEEEFEKTKKVLMELSFAKIHVFRYSPRPDTKGILLKDQVDEKTKKRRAKILLRLSKDLEKRWFKKFLGQTKNVLFEQKRKNFWSGLTDNYLRVYLKSEKNLTNQILPVRLEKLYKNGIIGRLTKTYKNS